MTSIDATQSDATTASQRELDLAIVPVVIYADGILYGSLEMNLRTVVPTA